MRKSISLKSYITADLDYGKGKWIENRRSCNDINYNGDSVYGH